MLFSCRLQDSLGVRNPITPHLFPLTYSIFRIWPLDYLIIMKFYTNTRQNIRHCICYIFTPPNYYTVNKIGSLRLTVIKG